MGRKDLSRTVIEGGRYYRNCWARRASHGVERARTREWLDRVRTDVDEAEDSVPEPKPRVGKMFRDKLGPAHRWIDAQVGRPWDRVRSELFEKFDTRTVAGRHVLFDHMLRDVDEHLVLPENFRRGDRWYVDVHGILRHALVQGRTWGELYRETMAWRGSRRVALTHRGWWWYARDVSSYCYARGTCTLSHVDGFHKVTFAAERPLTKGEKRRLQRLPDDLYHQVVIPARVVGG